MIVALAGNDRITATTGNDIVCAGAGNDTVTGGKGTDRLYGEADRDRLTGGAGASDRRMAAAAVTPAPAVTKTDKVTCERKRPARR